MWGPLLRENKAEEATHIKNLGLHWGPLCAFFASISCFFVWHTDQEIKFRTGTAWRAFFQCFSAPIGPYDFPGKISKIAPVIFRPIRKFGEKFYTPYPVKTGTTKTFAILSLHVSRDMKKYRCWASKFWGQKAADVWKTDVWDFQAFSLTLLELRFSLGNKGKDNLAWNSQTWPGTPRRPCPRHARPSPSVPL